MYLRNKQEKAWNKAVREMEQDIVNHQIASMFVGQNEQRAILHSLTEKCDKTK